MIVSSRGSDCGRTGLNDERGIALAIAVFALGVIGALVGGIFFAGRLEQQSGQNTIFAAQAGEVAEAGLGDAIGTIAAATLEDLPVGAPLDIDTLELAGGGSARRQVTRLTGSLFLIRVRGVVHSLVGTPLAERSLGLLVRLGPRSDSAADSGRVTRLGERGWVPLY